jgi:thiosulfate/3-mercaptopyruvate sulfurtransferase
MVAPFISADWLANHPEAVLADVRWYADGRSGLAAYEAAHLPGAVFVDLDRWLAAPPSHAEGRHPMPDPAVFAEGMRSVGIGDDDMVVAYDDDSGAIAARLVWMLRATGHQAALLDGGITAWRGVRVSGSVSRPEARFTERPWPASTLVSLDEVSAVRLLDARPRERYRGDLEPLDARPGHIPGAVNLPCRENVDPSGLLLPVPELRRRLVDAGVSDGPWASSCGSGVTACHTLLVAEHLGLPAGRLYAGSWSQWSHTDLPAATGDAPEAC